MKHIKLVFLLTMLMSMVGKTSLAHDIEVANDDGVTIYYKWINNNTELAVSFRGEYHSLREGEYTDNVVIPETVTYKGKTYVVASIDYCAFWLCSNLTSVDIPNSVTSIGEAAFSGCTGLTSIEIPNSVTNIGHAAFSGCSGLTSIEIPNGVTNIGDGAFSGCSGLTSIEIPNSVTSIGESAFRNCTGLISIEIPNSVTSIYSYAFEGCSGLTSIVVAAGNSMYDSRNNCKAIIETSTNTLIYGCKNTKIPDSVTSIGYEAFFGCSGLSSIDIPNSVTNIDSYAFYNCSGLTSIKIPNSVTNIGSNAFSGCSGLTSIDIPNSMTGIGEYAFSGCSGLTNVTVNSNEIMSKAYTYSSNLKTIFGNQVKEYTIGNEVTSIGYSAFNGCTGMNAITIPKNVTSIGNSAFSGCSGLTSIEIPNSVTSIGGAAFYDCSGLTSIEIPNSVTSIYSSTFYGCIGLTSIDIPNSVTSVGVAAFQGCSNLNSVTLGSGVASIEIYAFDGCTALTDLTSWATIPPVCEGGALTGISKANCTLTIPKGSLTNYQEARQWKDFTRMVEVNNSVNMLILPDLSAYVAKQALLNVGMANDDAITGMQFKLTVPTGVTVAEDNKGKLMLSKTERDEDHTLDGSKNDDGTYTILLFSNGSDAITGNSGDIIGITLDVSNTLAEGNYEIKLSDIVLSTTNAKKINLEDITSILSVSVMNGDVNDDGDVDVVDVTAVANYILGQQPASFVVKAADADYDGVIDVNDIVSIANIILYGNTTGASNVKRKAKSSTIMEANNDGIFVNNLTMQKGETGTLDFELVNIDHAYSGVQFEIQLPEGLSFALNNKGKVEVTKGDRLEDEEFTLSVAPQGENRYKVLGYYSDASSIPEHGGVLFSLSLVADENAPSGDASCNVTDVVLSTPDAQKIKPANKTFTVTIADPSGINAITMDGGTEMEIKETFDINGKKTTGLQRGLNIVKLKNGTLFKVVVK